MADSNGAAAILFDGVETPAQDMRLGLATLMANGTTRSLGAKSGRRPGTAGLPTIAGLTVTIPPSSAIADPAWSNTQGPYLVSWKQTQTVVLDPAPASNPRIDTIFVRVFDQFFDAQGQGKAIAFGKITGTPGSVPQAKTTLDDNVTPVSRVTVLGWYQVNPTGTPVFTPAPAIVAAGGIQTVRTDADLPANADEGTVVWDVRIPDFRVRVGNTWSTRDTRPMPTFQMGTAAVLTNASGTGTVNFTTPFAAVPAVVAVPASGGGGFAQCTVGDVNGVRFTFTARNNVGGLMLSSNVTVSYMAAVPAS